MTLRHAARARAVRRLRRFPGRALRGAGGGGASAMVAAAGTIGIGLSGGALATALRTERGWAATTGGTIIVIPDPDGAAAAAGNGDNGTRLAAAEALVGPDATITDTTATAALLAPWLRASDSAAPAQPAGADRGADVALAALLPAVLRLPGPAAPSLDAALARSVPGATITVEGGVAGGQLRRLGDALVVTGGVCLVVAIAATAGLLALVLRHVAERRVASMRTLLGAFGADPGFLRRAVARRAATAAGCGALLGAIPLAALAAGPLAPFSAWRLGGVPLPFGTLILGAVALPPLFAGVLGLVLGREPDVVAERRL